MKVTEITQMKSIVSSKVFIDSLEGLGMRISLTALLANVLRQCHYSSSQLSRFFPKIKYHNDTCEDIRSINIMKKK